MDAIIKEENNIHNKKKKKRKQKQKRKRFGFAGC
jgi:hypothetical protein